MSKAISIRLATIEDINTIGFLAQQTWPQTYGEILTTAQLDYMLNLIYSPTALRNQMVDEKQVFLLVEQDEEAIGFASWSTTGENGIFKLNKLYVLPTIQGKGMGRTILQFIIEDIRPLGATTLRLCVNRYNKARQFYEKLGFVVIGEEDTDIGNGYFMNDYIMELALSPVTH